MDVTTDGSIKKKERKILLIITTSLLKVTRDNNNKHNRKERCNFRRIKFHTFVLATGNDLRDWRS